MSIGETIVAVWLCIVLIVSSIKCLIRKDKKRGIMRMAFAVIDVPLLLCAVLLGTTLWTACFYGMVLITGIVIGIMEAYYYKTFK